MRATGLTARPQTRRQNSSVRCRSLECDLLDGIPCSWICHTPTHRTRLRLPAGLLVTAFGDASRRLGRHRLATHHTDACLEPTLMTGRSSVISMLRSVTLAFGASCVLCCRAPVRPAPLGDDSSDGVLVPLQLAVAPARDAVARALRANGFSVAAVSSQAIRTESRQISADTLLIVTATIVPVELSNARSYVTLSGTYSVGRSASATQVTRRADAVRGPWRYLTAVADSLRQISTRAP
jgi:hypothetical protein